jgi:hypothetical protein
VRGSTRFALCDGDDVLDAPWAGGLLALGARLARRALHSDRQLVVVMSIPTRDYAACLVAAGWVLAQRPAGVGVVADALPQLVEHAPIRFIARSQFVGDVFYGSARQGDQTRLHIGGSWWDVRFLEALASAPQLEVEDFGKVSISPTGSLIRRAHPNGSWQQMLVESRPSVRVVGTLTRLRNDLDIQVSLDEVAESRDSLRDVLWPVGDRPVGGLASLVTATSNVLPDLEHPIRLSVLDGVSSLDLLPDIGVTSNVAVILDRSAAESDAESQLIELRARSSVVEMADLGWKPAAGVEALAFEVPK